MANGVKVRGVTYRSMDEVDRAIRELAAQYVLMPEDDDRTGPLASHIGELLAALPDERAQSLVQLMRVEDGGGDAATAEPPPVIEDEVPVGHVRLDDGSVVPLCPMCHGHGILDEEPPQDPNAQRCPDCNGYGTVYTGSRVAGHATRACPTCTGNGWVAVDEWKQNGVARVSAATVPEWPGALWDAATLRWTPPEPSPPWDGAQWNDLAGRWQ